MSASIAGRSTILRAFFRAAMLTARTRILAAPCPSIPSNFMARRSPSSRLLQRELSSLQPFHTAIASPCLISKLPALATSSEDLQAQTNPTNLVNEDLANLEDGSSKPNNDANAINSSDTKSSASFEQKISPRHDLAMLFTCTVCETRSMKTCSRESYEKGVVVACCGGCNNLHLIADHLGYFGKPSNVEQFLAAFGEEVKKGSADTLNLTLEDIAGIKPQG
ncbi:hypothetical protein ACFX15_039553 [Malus domestica]